MHAQVLVIIYYDLFLQVFAAIALQNRAIYSYNKTILTFKLF